MATLLPRKPAATAAEQAVALAAGAWCQIGVSGWSSRHADWAIDLEPLIVFTASLERLDVRLQEEAIDWCVRNWRFISRTRVRNLARREPKPGQLAVGEFAATVAGSAGIPWPGATSARPFTVTGRSTLSPMERPSMAWIRLRSMFGVGARSEILRSLLSRPSGSASVTSLSDATGYMKRTIADECETLALSGLLSVRTVANRFHYTLTRRTELEDLLGEIAVNRPDWSRLFAVARELVLFERSEDTVSARTLPVHARKTLERIAEDLAYLDVDVSFADVHADALIDFVHDLGASTLAKWSVGVFPTRSSAPTGRVIKRAR